MDPAQIRRRSQQRFGAWDIYYPSKTWRRTWAGPNMEPAGVRRRSLRNRGAVDGPDLIWSRPVYGAGPGAVHGPDLIWSRPVYGAGPSSALVRGTSTPSKSWRRTLSGSNKSPAGVRRRTFEIVAPDLRAAHHPVKFVSCIHL